jgi:hypothetical protein
MEPFIAVVGAAADAQCSARRSRSFSQDSRSGAEQVQTAPTFTRLAGGARRIDSSRQLASVRQQ